MTFSTDGLISGIGQYLAANGPFAWPASAATGGDCPLYAMTVPLTPDRVGTVSPTAFTAHPTLASSVLGFQLRWRSAGEDVRDVWGLDDAAQSLLLGNFPLLLPTGVRLSSLVLQGGGSMGQDDNNRWVWASNWLASVDRKGSHR